MSERPSPVDWAADEDARYRPGPSIWPVVLSDWKRCHADVTITLRSGVQLGPGKVTDTGKPGWPGQLTAGGYGGLRETKWTFDLSQVVAVEAVAS